VRTESTFSIPEGMGFDAVALASVQYPLKFELAVAFMDEQPVRPAVPYLSSPAGLTRNHESSVP
jgi:hypothetical protein